jgi:hypothetical protein
VSANVAGMKQPIKGTPMNLSKLTNLSPLPVKPVSGLSDIPRDTYMVYILIHNHKEALVVGHGKYNRAKVICDDLTQTTSGHIKAMKVRLTHLFGSGEFSRFVIPCDSKKQAGELEAELHREIGGNQSALSDDIETALWKGIDPGSPEELLLKVARLSAFDGLYDLKRWRKEGIVPDAVWEPIAAKLTL